MTPGLAPGALRPPGTTLPAQVDDTTCGIAAVAAVAARAGGGLPELAGYLDAPRERVVAVQLRAHELASRVGPVRWPESLGTSPWALARMAGSATGLRYVTRRWGPHTRLLMVKAVAAGEDCFLYVGGGTTGAPAGSGRVRTLAEGTAARLDRVGMDVVPRHVVAVLGEESTSDLWAVFDPASGRVEGVKSSDLWAPKPERREALGWWRRPLFAVLPARPTKHPSDDVGLEAEPDAELDAALEAEPDAALDADLDAALDAATVDAFRDPDSGVESPSRDPADPDLST